MTYDHDTFMKTLDSRLAEIKTESDADAPPPIATLLHIVGMTFGLFHAMNENLNRIAVAHEKMNEIAERDFHDYVAQEIASGVEKELATPRKRDYIGKHD